MIKERSKDSKISKTKKATPKSGFLFVGTQLIASQFYV